MCIMEFEKEEFSIYLTSNSSVDVYPQNCPSKFTNNLADPIKFTNRMECCVNEIIFSQETLKLNARIHLVWSFFHYPPEENINFWDFNVNRIASFIVPHGILNGTVENFMIKFNRHQPRVCFADVYCYFQKLNLFKDVSSKDIDFRMPLIQR